MTSVTSDAPFDVVITLAVTGWLGVAAVSATISALTRAMGHSSVLGDEVTAVFARTINTHLAHWWGRRWVLGAVGGASIILAVTTTTFAVTAMSGGRQPWWGTLMSVLLITVCTTVAGIASGAAMARHHPATVLAFFFPLLALTGTSVIRDHETTAHSHQPVDEVQTVTGFADHSGTDTLSSGSDQRSLADLRDTPIRAVMVPRTDMITVARTAPLDKAQKLFIRSGFSRLPVIGDSSDDVHGVLYFKDVARVLLTSPHASVRTAQDTMRPVWFVPESTHADDVLRSMQSKRAHIAMVVDEYGGIAGLVTAEDILEEIVGELTDEHDSTPTTVDTLNQGVLRVPARMTLDELSEYLHRPITDDDVDTIAGLLTKALGKLPIAQSQATINGLHLLADEFTGRRKQLSTIIVTDLSSSDLRDELPPEQPAHTPHQSSETTSRNS